MASYPAFRFSSRPTIDQTVNPTQAEVVLQERAVHTERMALGTGQVVGTLVEQHAFVEEGVTAMRMTQTYPSKEECDGAIASGMDQGMEACYQ